MRGAAPRTIYESSARRARRRSRRLFAAALAVLVLAAAGGTAALVLWRDGGARAGPRPAALTPSAPAAAPRTTALSSVEVRRGEQTRLRYRIDGAVDDTWTATLVVLAKDGGQVKAQRLGASVPAEGVHAVTVRAETLRLDLPAVLRQHHERGRPSPGSEDQHGQRRREQPAAAAARPPRARLVDRPWGRAAHGLILQVRRRMPVRAKPAGVGPVASCRTTLAERHGSRTHPGQDHCPADGFEDRGSHRTTSRSARPHLPTPAPAGVTSPDRAGPGGPWRACTRTRPRGGRRGTRRPA